MAKGNSADENATRFPFLLREALTFREMSQRELAGKLGMDEAYISRILKGEYNPRWDSAIRIALILRLPLAAFAPVGVFPLLNSPMPDAWGKRKRKPRKPSSDSA